MFVRFFQEGGFGMYWLVALSLAGVVVAGLHAAGQARMRWPAWLLAAACVAAGAGFMLLGQSTVDRATALVAQDEREEMLVVGYREAQRPLQLGVGLGVLVAAIAWVGEVKRKSSP